MTAGTKITRLQNHDHEHFTRKDLWAEVIFDCQCEIWSDRRAVGLKRSVENTRANFIQSNHQLRTLRFIYNRSMGRQL